MYGVKRNQQLHRVVLAAPADSARPKGTRRARAAADGLRPRNKTVCDPRAREELGRRVPCALCGREARGFGFCLGLRRDRHPYHRFCSLACQNAGSANAKRNFGVIDKTDMETRAIRDARAEFAAALTDIGLMEPFFDRPAAEIDALIEACVDGFQSSMRRQSDAGEIPF